MSIKFKAMSGDKHQHARVLLFRIHVCVMLAFCSTVTFHTCLYHVFKITANDEVVVSVHKFTSDYRMNFDEIWYI
jgi:hypothetical protein